MRRKLVEKIQYCRNNSLELQLEIPVLTDNEIKLLPSQLNGIIGLNLVGVSLSENKYQEIVRFLTSSTSLSTFGVSKSLVDVRQAVTLKRVIRGNSNIKEFCVEDNDMSKSPSVSLSLIIKNSSLDALKLINIKLEERGVEKLASTIIKGTRINSIYLEGEKEEQIFKVLLQQSHKITKYVFKSKVVIDEDAIIKLLENNYAVLELELRVDFAVQQFEAVQSILKRNKVFASDVVTTINAGSALDNEQLEKLRKGGFAAVKSLVSGSQYEGYVLNKIIESLNPKKRSLTIS